MFHLVASRPAARWLRWSSSTFPRRATNSPFDLVGTHRHTDRQTDRQTERQTDREKDREHHGHRPLSLCACVVLCVVLGLLVEVVLRNDAGWSYGRLVHIDQDQFVVTDTGGWFPDYLLDVHTTQQPRNRTTHPLSISLCYVCASVQTILGPATGVAVYLQPSPEVQRSGAFQQQQEQEQEHHHQQQQQQQGNTATADTNTENVMLRTHAKRVVWDYTVSEQTQPAQPSPHNRLCKGAFLLPRLCLCVWWSVCGLLKAPDDITSNCISVKRGDWVVVIRSDSSGWSYGRRITDINDISRGPQGQPASQPEHQMRV